MNLTWRLKSERNCSEPTDLVVKINKTQYDVKLSHPFNAAHLKHDFEFCGTYLFCLRFESMGGKHSYPYTLHSKVEYPGIVVSKGNLSMRNDFGNLNALIKP